MDVTQVSEGMRILYPLLAFAFGISFYGFCIFKFYRFLARRDIFRLNLKKYNKARHPTVKKAVDVAFYIAEHIALFPLIAFFWFIMLAFFLAFLSENQTPQDLLLISMSVVASTRITSYYKEDLSRDLAKLLPFALLGVFLVDMTYFSLDNSLSTITGMVKMPELILYYLLFIIGLEFLLRMFYSIIKALKKS